MPKNYPESRKKWQLLNPAKANASRRRYRQKPEQKMVHHCLCGGQFTIANKQRHFETNMHRIWEFINPADVLDKSLPDYFGVVVFK